MPEEEQMMEEAEWSEGMKEKLICAGDDEALLRRAQPEQIARDDSPKYASQHFNRE